MAPTAARRARPVQRCRHQGLRGNPDACHPGRGSACNETARRAGGNADPVFAGRTQPTAAMNPRTGGSRVGEAPRPFFPPISSGRNGGARRAGAPPGAPRQVDGAPRSSRPTGWWIRRQAGAHTGAPLRIDSAQFLDLTRRATTGHPRGRRAESSRPTGPAVAGENGRMISAPTTSAQAADHSLGLLSPRRPLRWVAAGGPIGCAESYPRAPSLAPLGQFTLSRPTGYVSHGNQYPLTTASSTWAATEPATSAPEPPFSTSTTKA